MYRNYTVCVHVHNLHPGANLHPGVNKFAPTRRQEQICTRVQIGTRLQILKTPFTWPKIHPGANLHPGCKFAPGAICTGCKLRTRTRLKIQKHIFDLFYNHLRLDFDFNCVHCKQSYINDKRMLCRTLVKRQNLRTKFHDPQVCTIITVCVRLSVRPWSVSENAQ